MTDLLVLDLVDKGLVTNQIVLTVGYDIDNLKDPSRRKDYHGEIKTDRYGRSIPKHAHGTANLKTYTSSTRLITQAVMELFDRIVDEKLLVRRMEPVKWLVYADRSNSIIINVQCSIPYGFSA